MTYTQNALYSRFTDQLRHAGFVHILDCFRYEFKRPEDIHALKQAYEEDNIWAHHTLQEIVENSHEAFADFHPYYADTTRLAESVRGGNHCELWDTLVKMCQEYMVEHLIEDALKSGGYDEYLHVKTNKLLNGFAYYVGPEYLRREMYSAIETFLEEQGLKVIEP